MSVVCNHDSDLIVGVYSTFYEWVFWIHHHQVYHMMHMFIIFCHGEVMWQESVELTEDASALDFCFILEASNFIVGSSFSGPRNENSH